MPKSFIAAAMLFIVAGCAAAPQVPTPRSIRANGQSTRAYPGPGGDEPPYATPSPTSSHNWPCTANPMACNEN